MKLEKTLLYGFVDVLKKINLQNWKRYTSQKQLKNVALTIFKDIKRSDLLQQSSGMAYTMIFSLVPSLAAVFSLLSLFVPVLGSQANIMSKAQDFILQNLATGTGDQVVKYLDQFLGGLDFKKIGITSFAGLFVTLILLLKQIEESLNRIWMVHKGRNMFLRFVYFWTFLTLGAFLLSIVLGMTANFSFLGISPAKTLNEATSGSGFFSRFLTWGTWIVFFFLVYKIIPNCKVNKRSAFIGAFTSGTLLYWSSALYGIYAKNFNNYKNIYGTLAAIPLFLMWIYICWTIVLFGALIGWRVQTGFPTEAEKDISKRFCTSCRRSPRLRKRRLI